MSPYLRRVCLVATLGGLLFGYDTAVISGAIGFLQAHFALGPGMTGWTSACVLAGCALGAAGAGVASDRLGRRRVLLLSAVLFLVSALGTALPRTLGELIFFRILGGLGVGAASMTSPMYIAEISPARIRGRMVSLNQLTIVSGILLVYFVNYFIARYGEAAGGEWNVVYGWRWMFGSEAIPALALLVLLFFVPESPRWLVKQGRPEEARDVLVRVGGAAAAARELEEIRRAIAAESGSLRQLGRPGMRVALLIGVVLAVLQQITGINVFLYFGPTIFKEIGGERVDASLLQTIVVGAVNLAFTLVAIRTVDRWGRRPLMIAGAAGMGLSLAALGLAAYRGATGAWLLVFILGYIACFALSVGPVTWVILAEIFPTRIRGRAMAIATVVLWLADLAVTQTFPSLDAEGSWLVERFHHAFPFWLYGAFCAFLVFFVRRFVPETKGRSLEEIERFWGAP
ncbi:MAG: sugar porter family MFS transporter [Planctomycetota bacterium]